MSKRNFVICIDNTDYPASLEKRKIYEVIEDKTAAAAEHLRVIDESGEGYLYPASCFIDAQFPDAVQKAVTNAT
jgi:hypothetical protein